MSVAPVIANPDAARAELNARTAELFEQLSAADQADRGTVMAEITRLYAPLVEQIARRYRHRGEAADDLRQVGYLGLMKAISGYRPGRGPLMPYAAATIAGEIKKHFRDRGWAVRPTRAVQELEMRLAGVRSDLEQEFGRAATAADMAARLGESVDAVRAAQISRHFYHLMSTETIVRGAGDVTVGDRLGRVDSHYQVAEASAMLRNAVASSGLSQRDRQVLFMRFFQDLTQREVADQIGVTQMQVSRIQTRALAILRAQLGDLDQSEPDAAAPVPFR